MWAIGAVVVAALVFVTVKVVGGADDGDDVSADRVGQVVDGPEAAPEEGGSEEGGDDEGGTETSETTESPPLTVAAEVDLFADPAKPFEVYAGIFDGQPVKVMEILIYPDRSHIQVQNPDVPTYIDEYAWNGGNGVSGPTEPVALTVSEEDIPEHLFDLSEIDQSKLPGMVAQTKAQFPGKEVEVSHMIIERFLPFDTRVFVLVYFEYDRTSGYITYTPDGGLVEVVS